MAVLSKLVAANDTDSSFFCGIVANQSEMLDLFDQVFLQAIDEDTQLARLAQAVIGSH